MVGAVGSLVGEFVSIGLVQNAHPELKAQEADFWGYVREHQDFSNLWGPEEFADVFAIGFPALLVVALFAHIAGNVGMKKSA